MEKNVRMEITWNDVTQNQEWPRIARPSRSQSEGRKSSALEPAEELSTAGTSSQTSRLEEFKFLLH